MSQDLILAMVSAVAGVCLVIGIAQALAPPPRRRRRVRRRVARAPSERRPGAPVPAGRPRAEAGDRVSPRPAAAEAPPKVERTLPSSRRRAAPTFTPRSRPAPPETPPVVPPATVKPSTSRAGTVSPVPEVAPPLAAPAAPPTAARPSPRPPAVELPLDQCRALYQGRKHQDVIAMVEPVLQRVLAETSGSVPRAEEIAELWSLLALSRQAVGDEEGARSAFEEAIHTAPEAGRPTYQQQLAALATHVGRRLLARAEQIAEGASEERIGTLRQAIRWLRQGLAEVAGDGELSSALERARRGLWTAYGQTVTALIQRQEFHRARRLIRDALGEEEFPPDRRQQFNELLSATFTGEIGQLTASAIRALEDERDGEALTFLQRAEGILNSVSAEAIPAKRREEVNRRLWWGYTKLGMRRVEAGDHEEAIEPLFRALRIGEISTERQQETREAIVRALVGVVDARAAVISQLVKEGKRSGAVEEGERLKTLIREGLERGLSQEELSPVFSRARRVLELIEQGAGT